MSKKSTTTSVSTVPACRYSCDGSNWILIGGNPPAGFHCPSNAGACSVAGQEFSMAPVPDEPPAALAANTGEYVFQKTTKSLHFRGGSCGNGKHFQPTITLKELSKIDADAAELVKSLQKNKKVSSFSVLLKAQKVEKA